MRVLFIFLTMIVYAAGGLGQEKARIDMDGAGTRTDPSVTTQKVNMPGVSAPTGPKSLWRLDLLPIVQSSPSIVLYEIHLVNGSTSTLVLPVSQNGIKLTAACPEHAVSSLSLALSRKDEHFSKARLEQFYGCEGQSDSLVSLKPGEWISFTGKVRRVDIKTEVRADAALSRVKYMNTANGMVADEAVIAILFSPWQSLAN